MFMKSFILFCDSVWSFSVKVNRQVFYRLCICIAATHLYTSKDRTWISINICRGVFFVINDLRRIIVVRFVDIDRIVDHHCFDILWYTIVTELQTLTYWYIYYRYRI
jgi:intracellular septation protein A